MLRVVQGLLQFVSPRLDAVHASGAQEEGLGLFSNVEIHFESVVEQCSLVPVGIHGFQGSSCRLLDEGGQMNAGEVGPVVELRVREGKWWGAHGGEKQQTR